MIGEKHNFSLFSPTVKLTICRAHDQYVEKKIVWFQKGFHIPPPPLHRRGFCLGPHLSGNSSQASYIYLKFWALWEPPTPPQEFPIPSVEGVCIFSGTTPWISISMTKGISLNCLSNMTNLHCHPYIPGSFDMPDQVKYIVYKVITAACNRPELGWPYESKANLKLICLLL